MTSYLFWAIAVTCLLPQIPAGVGLLLGIAFALTLGNPDPARTKLLSQKFLACAVVGLGASMNLLHVGEVGLAGVRYTLVGIAGTLVLGAILARAFRVAPNVGLLLSVGTAICGGSAIAAVAAVVRPKDEETSVSLATVFLLNASALFLFPFVGKQLVLSPVEFGLWSALAIHDTSSVVGAAIQFGGEAVDVATTVKLARALWILPIALFFAFYLKQGSAGKVKRPWFIVGFVLAAALVTFVPALREAGEWVAYGAKRLMVVTLFLIGAGLSRAAIAKVGWRPFALGIVLWIVVASLSLIGIRAGWVHL